MSPLNDIYGMLLGAVLMGVGFLAGAHVSYTASRKKPVIHVPKFTKIVKGKEPQFRA